MQLFITDKCLGLPESLTEHFPEARWQRCMVHFCRMRVVGNFSDGESALMLVAAGVRHVAGITWGTRRYLDMEHLNRSPKPVFLIIADLTRHENIYTGCKRSKPLYSND